MKKVLLVGLITVVAVLALAGAGVAFAQIATPNPENPFSFRGAMIGAGFGGNGMIGGRYHHNGMMGQSILHEYMVAAWAEALGLSPEDIQARLDGGETMATIAEEKGLTLDEFRSLMAEVHNNAIDLALADGAITQEQADFMNERMQTMQENGFMPGAGGCGKLLGRGGRGAGYRWQNAPQQ